MIKIKTRSVLLFMILQKYQVHSWLRIDHNNLQKKLMNSKTFYEFSPTKTWNNEICWRLLEEVVCWEKSFNFNFIMLILLGGKGGIDPLPCLVNPQLRVWKIYRIYEKLRIFARLLEHKLASYQIFLE